jgi:hypothetical protein
MSKREKTMAEVRERELWRFSDLQALGICADRQTMRRWQRAETDPFPQPLVLSGNSIAWRAQEVRAWLDRRPRGPAPQPNHIAAERQNLARAIGDDIPF